MKYIVEYRSQNVHSYHVIHGQAAMDKFERSLANASRMHPLAGASNITVRFAGNT